MNVKNRKVRRATENNNDSLTKDKSVFSSLDNLQQFKPKKPSDDLSKFKQIYDSIALGRM